MENKPTAVEWLYNHLFPGQLDGFSEEEWNKIDKAFEQAKLIERQHQEQCWKIAHQAGRFEGKGIAEENWQTFEQYYNEEYGEE